MSEKYAEALDELLEIARQLRSEAQDSTYGFFHGGDPRDFSPDPEASTEEERQRHLAACASWSAGKGNPNPAPQCAFMNGGVAPAGFGLGVNTHIDEEALDRADRIERCVDRLRDWP